MNRPVICVVLDQLAARRRGLPSRFQLTVMLCPELAEILIRHVINLAMINRDIVIRRLRFKKHDPFGIIRDPRSPANLHALDDDVRHILNIENPRSSAPAHERDAG